MKLIVRSSYWGPVIRGKTSAYIDVQQVPYIIAQACDEADPRKRKKRKKCFTGCCPEFGERIVSMEERHFLDFHDGEWDLYQTQYFLLSGKSIYEFILLPKSDTYSNVIQQGTTNRGWLYVGVTQAAIIRMDLARLLHPYLSMNQVQKHRNFQYHHCHIRVVMTALRDKFHPFERQPKTLIQDCEPLNDCTNIQESKGKSKGQQQEPTKRSRGKSNVATTSDAFR